MTFIVFFGFYQDGAALLIQERPPVNRWKQTSSSNEVCREAQHTFQQEECEHERVATDTLHYFTRTSSTEAEDIAWCTPRMKFTTIKRISRGFSLGFLLKRGKTGFFFNISPMSPLRKFPLPSSPEFLCGNFRLGFRLPPLLPSGKLT